MRSLIFRLPIGAPRMEVVPTWLHQTHQHLQCRRLPSTIWAQKAENLPSGDIQTQPIYGVHGAQFPSIGTLPLISQALVLLENPS